MKIIKNLFLTPSWVIALAGLTASFINYIGFMIGIFSDEGAAIISLLATILFVIIGMLVKTLETD